MIFLPQNNKMSSLRAGQTLRGFEQGFQGQIDPTTGGSGTVTSVATGTGLSGGPITTTGTINLANTAVTAGSYTAANLTVDAQGRITAAANGVAGTVTSVATGTGLSGGPITSTGTINLANTTVTAGSYTNTNLTVDAQGRITTAANGTTSATGAYLIYSLNVNSSVSTTSTVPIATAVVSNAAFTVSAGGTFTCVTAGTYAVTCHFQANSAAVGQLVFNNGGEVPVSQGNSFGVSASTSMYTVKAFVAGDTIRLVNGTGGAAVTFTGDSGGYAITYMQIIRIA